MGACLLLDSMKEYELIKSHRNSIYKTYVKNIIQNEKIKCVQAVDKNAKEVMWLFTIISRYKDIIQKKLREKNIETNQVHFRNDKYSIFKKFSKNKTFKNMDKLQDKYLVLPMHTKMTINDAKRVSFEINKIIKELN